MISLKGIYKCNWNRNVIEVIFFHLRPWNISNNCRVSVDKYIFSTHYELFSREISLTSYTFHIRNSNLHFQYEFKPISFGTYFLPCLRESYLQHRAKSYENKFSHIYARKENISVNIINCPIGNLIDRPAVAFVNK